MEQPKTIQQKLQELRTQNKLTQKEVANKLNYKVSFVQNLENGKYKPTGPILQKLEKNTPFFLAELSNQDLCPRTILRNVLSQLQSLGYKSKSEFEYESESSKITSCSHFSSGARKWSQRAPK